MPDPTLPLADVLKVGGALIGTIVALIIYAWHKMEKTQDSTIEALEKHTENDERIHNDLFSQVRTTEAKVNKLIGEHEGIHRGDK